MKEHKLFCLGIIGIFINLIYLGLLYQSGEILNSILSINNSSWNGIANDFVNPIAFALGLCGLIGAFTCCVIDIIITYINHK